MLVPRQVFSLAAITSKKKTRSALNGVLIDRKIGLTPRAVATDGHKLLMAEWEEIPMDEYPSDPELKPEISDVFLGALVPANQCKKISELAPKNGFRPILKNVVLDESSTERLSFGGTDLETTQKLSVKPIEGKFPNLESIIPSENRSSVDIEVNSQYLMELLKAVQAITGDNDKIVRLRLDSHDAAKKPMEISTVSDDGIKLRGILMPVCDKNSP